MTQWVSKPLGEVAELCLGKMLDEQKNKGELLPYLANINVRWGDFNLENLREMRFAHNEMDRYGLRRGDIVMCEGGEPGRCAIWQESVPAMMIQKALHRIRPKSDLDHRYLFYFFLYTGCIGGFAPLFTGATIKHLPKQSLEKLNIKYPPLDIQKRVADILSTYDDLIENNRRRMALLEESARLLYREWFVRLRFPGYEHTPIVDGVPQGWSKGVVSDFYETSSGGTPSRKIAEYFTGDIPWVKTQELSNGFITETDEHITDNALKNSSAKLFPNRTVLIALYGATVGELGITALPASTNQACCALLQKDPRGHYAHAFLFFRENKDVLVGLSAGAAQKNISQQIVRGVPMVMATAALMSMFVDIVSPMFEQMLNLQLANQKLRAARDLLLPRLMNGELAA